MSSIRLSVNGNWHDIDVPANRTLLSVLRDDLRLTGTKSGCTVGVCGLCSVLVDGQLVASCLELAVAVDGADITTIEGINRPDVQQAFVDHAGMQCGICTPGQIVAASALLSTVRAPTSDEIKTWMMGNLCRCTGYVGIVESVAAAATGVGADAVERSERLDAPDKAAGLAAYAADLTRPGMLFGAVLRSPHPHARIVSIDTTRARAADGVHAVLTGADIPPDVRVGRNMRDMPVLAREKVRFIGEKVAAVAAASLEAAEAAVRLIEVEYEPLPAVFDPLEAMQPGAPVIHTVEDVQQWAAGDQVVPDYPNGASSPSWGASATDVEAALDAAPAVIEHTFRTSMQHQGYLEPHACLVEVDERGVAHIWAANKAPLLLARYLRQSLGLERDRLALHLLPLGGDFGGKGSFMDIPLAYLLACASRRPVRMAMSYVDELSAGNPRHAATIVVRTGLGHDGTILARSVKGYFASGGYAAFKPSTDTTLPGFRRGAFGPYHVPVLRAECHMVYTNTVPCGHMRSPGEAQVAYAIEAHTELLARQLGIDPLEFRVRNATHHGRPADDPDGDPKGAVPPRAREVLAAAGEAISFGAPREVGVGRGLALIEFSTSPGVYGGILHVERDGRVRIQTPIVEQGAGMLTVFRKIVAEELGLPMAAVDVEQSVDGIEDDRGVGGSRTTRLVGKLLIQLSRRAQSRLADSLAAEFGVDRASVTLVPGGFSLAAESGSCADSAAAGVTPSVTRERESVTRQRESVTRASGGSHSLTRFVSFAEAAALLDAPLSESLLFRAGERDRSTVFIAQAAEVCVDLETGAVVPRRIVTVQEAGRIIDPLLAQRQVEGAVVQGLGYAVMEQLVVQDGRVQNVNLHEYKLPTQADVPVLETIFIAHDPQLGITPVGEGALAGVAPAVVNAVVDVIGPHAFDLPLSPESVHALSPKRA